MRKTIFIGRKREIILLAKRITLMIREEQSGDRVVGRVRLFRHAEALLDWELILAAVLGKHN
jgi:hypothetical protein